MKKTIISSLILCAALIVPMFASASIDANLFYGIHNKPEVQELQEFLIGKGFLTGNATGNFYSLTLAAVKQYQASVGISKTGYVGTLTRKSINDELAADLQDSNTESVNETGSVPVIPPQEVVSPVPPPIAQPQVISAPTKPVIVGCTESSAPNYDPNATQDNGTCKKYDILAATCTPDNPVIAPWQYVVFSINATGGDGKYKYTAFFCYNNFCKTNFSNQEIGIQTKTVQVKSGDNQFVSVACSVDVENK